MSPETVLENIKKNLGDSFKVTNEQLQLISNNIIQFQKDKQVSSKFVCLGLGEVLIYPNKDYQKTLLARYNEDVVKMYTSFISKKGKIALGMASPVQTAPKRELTEADKEATKKLFGERSVILTEYSQIGIVDEEKQIYKYSHKMYKDGALIYEKTYEAA